MLNIEEICKTADVAIKRIRDEKKKDEAKKYEEQHLKEISYATEKIREAEGKIVRLAEEFGQTKNIEVCLVEKVLNDYDVHNPKPWGDDLVGKMITEHFLSQKFKVSFKSIVDATNSKCVGYKIFVSL